MTATYDGLLSPFSALTVDDRGEAQAPDPGGWTGEAAGESPFASLVAPSPDLAAEEVAGFLESLHDEDFADTLERLTDEAAAHHLADLGGWSGQVSEGESVAALEHWLEPLAEASERAVDALAEGIERAQLSALGPESLGEEELEQLLERFGEPPVMEDEAFSQFLGGLVKKARRFAAKAIKAVGRVAGKLLPIGALLKKAGRAGAPAAAQGAEDGDREAAGVGPPARDDGRQEARHRRGRGAGRRRRRPGRGDLEVASLLLAPDAGPTDARSLSEEEVWQSEEQYRDVVAELEAGRERLAEQLTSLAPGESPAPAIQQFVPLVLAVRPLLKMAVTVIGRDRVVRFFGDKLGLLLKPIVGAQASALLGRPLADVGMRVIGFEHAAGAEQDRPGQRLAGEALASTVESAVLRTLELVPPEAQEDELQLEAALGTAFAESAAAYLPDSLLRGDLAERETSGEGGVWVFMPRASRPRYRFRRYSRVFAVPVTRQVAQSVPWSEGGTLESHLLERGVERWPAEAEVHLYEALPGTHFGHLTQDESLPEGERADSSEYQALTPEVAGLLLGEPRLGRSLPGSVTGAPGRARPVPGRRYFRVRLPGAARPRPARRRRRVLLALDLPKGRLRVALRLSERQAQQVLLRLQPPAAGAARDLPGVLAALRRLYAPVLVRRMSSRLQRRALVPDPTAAAKAAQQVRAGVDAALSSFLSAQSGLLAAAVKDPADGVLVTVTFSGVTRTSLGAALPPGTVTVTPGWQVRG